ncbi:hypothetical protein HanOQP8_Chr03g0100041 [Helianthus annuus]|nr:hypothetical protein HanOQP8_Chr03g0100041 [Helianthus annuus]
MAPRLCHLTPYHTPSPPHRTPSFLRLTNERPPPPLPSGGGVKTNTRERERERERRGERSGGETTVVPSSAAAASIVLGIES